MQEQCSLLLHKKGSQTHTEWVFSPLHMHLTAHAVSTAHRFLRMSSGLCPSSRTTARLSEGGCWIWRITVRRGGEKLLGQRTPREKLWIINLPGNFNPYSFHCVSHFDCTFFYCCRSSAASVRIMSWEQNMSTNPTIDHCRAPNPVTYQTLFWLIIAEFVLGLPLNLSVLYIFVFR